MSFLEDLASPSTLRTAWQDVAAKNGAPGIDRVAIADLAPEIESHLEQRARLPLRGVSRPAGSIQRSGFFTECATAGSRSPWTWWSRSGSPWSTG